MWNEKFDTNNKPLTMVLSPYLLVALYKIGGSAPIKRALKEAIDLLDSSQELLDLDQKFKTGRRKNFLKYRYEWSMSKLRTTDYVKKQSSRGIWELTDKGTELAQQLADDGDINLVNSVRKEVEETYKAHMRSNRDIKLAKSQQGEHSEDSKENFKDEPMENDDNDVVYQESWENDLIEEDLEIQKDLQKIHQKLKPLEFEQLCVRLLNEMDANVQITPGSHDGGIDAEGLINVGPINFRIVAQFKMHDPKKPIGPAIVDQLKGSMEKFSADRAILISTSSYTKTAKKAAHIHSIRLIDGEELIELMKKYEVMYKLSLDLDN